MYYFIVAPGGFEPVPLKRFERVLQREKKIKTITDGDLTNYYSVVKQDGKEHLIMIGYTLKK